MKGYNVFSFLRTAVLSLIAVACLVEAKQLNQITSGYKKDGAYEIQIQGDDLSGFSYYTLENPAQIILDIPFTKNALGKRKIKFSSDIVNNIVLVQGKKKLRAAIKMPKLLPLKVTGSKGRISIILKDPKKGRLASNKKVTNKKPNTNFRSKSKGVISQPTARFEFAKEGIDTAKLIIKLPSDRVNVTLNRVGKKIIANLNNARFDRVRRLNVKDFSTPVESIDLLKNRLEILTLSDDFEIVSFQNLREFIIEISKPIKKDTNIGKLPPGDSRKEYTGEKLSLNFQDIEVRAVLNLIGDFTNNNVVVSDEVTGSITLRLNDVPWDQALDIILQTKGLSVQKNGNIMYIAPSSRIAENKKSAYEVSNIEQELAPLQQELIQVQFARADNLLKIIQGAGQNVDPKRNRRDALISSRGSVAVDKRTNTLIVNEVPSNIEKIRRLISQLDIEVRQVLIDARIVSASNNFAHELGIRWSNDAGSVALDNLGSSDRSRATRLGSRLGVDLRTRSAGTFGLQVLSSDLLLSLELTALEEEGRGEIISSPKVVAQDGNEAVISSGTKIPFSVVNDDGVANVQFEDAELNLTVTPKIAPNNKIDMILNITRGSIGSIVEGRPTINSSTVTSQVLVENGSTVVLGGIYEENKTKSVSKVPLLGDLPVLGRLFRNDVHSYTKSELLIFITPKILDKQLSKNDKFSSLRD